MDETKSSKNMVIIGAIVLALVVALIIYFVVRDSDEDAPEPADQTAATIDTVIANLEAENVGYTCDKEVVATAALYDQQLPIPCDNETESSSLTVTSKTLGCQLANDNGFHSSTKLLVADDVIVGPAAVVDPGNPETANDHASALTSVQPSINGISVTIADLASTCSTPATGTTG